jgi:hypothetical protein
LLDQQHIIDQRRCGVREYGHSTASPTASPTASTKASAAASATASTTASS